MKLHLVGGFLGSGKTTAILQAAKILMDQGSRVGIVTNEQGKHLVDTGLLQSEALPTLEVTGGCICCHLDDFNERIDELINHYQPDIIFAESVGSCTNLVATVIKPLLDLRRNFNSPASLSVFTDARLFYRYLAGLEMPFSDGIVYIFEKQLEESELIMINKIDLLDNEKKSEILHFADRKYPSKRFRAQNSLKSDQVADWLDILEPHQPPVPLISLDIDYDRYAQGEKRFSWVDRKVRIEITHIDLLLCLENCILAISHLLCTLPGNIAHVKFLLRDDQRSLKFSLTALDKIEDKFANLHEQITTFKSMEYELCINAMLEGELDAIVQTIDTIIQNELNIPGIHYKILAGFTRVPGYPKPTKRIVN